MRSNLDTAIGILGLILGFYLYLYLHEYVHWGAGKFFSGDPNVLYDNWYTIPFPYAVEFRNLTEMPNWGIRIAGISPHAIWTSFALYQIGNPFSVIETNTLITIATISDAIVSTPFVTLIFLTASVGAGVSVSPADLVATFRPEKYREYTGRGLSHLAWGRVLVGHTS